MKSMGLNQLREAFLAFFEEKGHYRLPSFSLVPQDDKSLLLINSGMAPMKKFFVGEITPPSKRVTTCQKCIRTGDIENVGYTSRHLTYFEMLGNFSFGDYFKRQAIAWAWEFFTKVLEIPAELLYISVYQEDDEAYDIWTQEIGVPPAHMVRLGKEDNFWEHGSGPCGPCSELHYDRGPENGCGKPECAPGCDCDRFIEIGNIVFSQFVSDGKGNYTPIANPNIDFGMGLERLACMMQNVDNVFMVDTMQKIMGHAERLAGVTYGTDPKQDISLKIITDHIRSVTFMVGDGILGSNEGRGYVLRRLLRRAARHGKLLGLSGVFLCKIAETVIAENRSAYPELAQKQEMIVKVIRNEEESFAKTIDQGLEILNRLVDKLAMKTLSGDDAFLLNDTYGFPLDLTKEILAEQAITVDEARFMALMQQQKERARSARKNAGGDAWEGEENPAENLPATEFTGYTQNSTGAKVLAIIQDGQRVSSAANGDTVTVVLDKTPFYAESGGQVADTGRLFGNGTEAAVASVAKNHEAVYLHHVTIHAGILEEGMEITAEINVPRREAIRRNHTAAHLLQAALREVLGEHVEQAGQLVDDEKMRFDFTHFSALTAEEIKAVETRVNEEIFKAIPVLVREMPIDEARKQGAMALFGEKYGDVVRVVSVGNFSLELCGGTHAENTANVGLFQITGESSVASGVRRMEGVTGAGVLKLLKSYAGILTETMQSLKSSQFAELPTRARQLTAELHEANKKLESLNDRLAADSVQGLFADALEINGVKIITAFFSGTGTDALKTLCDRVRDLNIPVVAVFGGGANGKVSFAATASKEAQQLGVRAGQLVKEVAQITGGNGGGGADFAMAGGKDPAKVEEALAAVADIYKKLTAMK